MPESVHGVDHCTSRVTNIHDAPFELNTVHRITMRCSTPSESIPSVPPVPPIARAVGVCQIPLVPALRCSVAKVASEALGV